jgi:preprotein translocase subunit SecB
MKHKVSDEQLSALRFERVWVREATFLDVEGEQATLAPQELEGVGIQLDVRVAYSERGDRAFVTVRASLESPSNKQFFLKLAAAVEGAFSLRREADPKLLHTFATVQAPVLLVPYLRQVITNLTAQSRVGAMVLPPLNMVEITKAMQAQTAKEGAPATS